jgi:SAM-dependent methyltransferase
VANEILHIPLVNPRILDYGSGSGRVLTRIFEEQGYPCRAYDPLYGIGDETAENRYDCIFLCEVIEHLRDLLQVVRHIDRLLKDTGYLVIRTELYQSADVFNTWWYIQDKTHINFFSMKTMAEFGRVIRREIFFTNNKNLIIFGNSATTVKKGAEINR